MFDVHSRCKVVSAIAAAVLAADAVSGDIDLIGFKGAEIFLSIGAGGIVFTTTNKVEFKITQSADGVTWTEVAQADIIGATVTPGGIVKSLIAAHATGAAYRLGYVGNGRYIRITADFGGVHATGTPIAAMVSLSKAEFGPQAAQI